LPKSTTSLQERSSHSLAMQICYIQVGEKS